MSIASISMRGSNSGPCSASLFLISAPTRLMCGTLMSSEPNSNQSAFPKRSNTVTKRPTSTQKSRRRGTGRERDRSKQTGAPGTGRSAARRPSSVRQTSRRVASASGKLLERVTKLRAAGNLASAARLLAPFAASSSKTPAVKRAVSSLASEAYRLAKVSYSRRDLRKARSLVRILLRLGGIHATRARHMAQRMEAKAAGRRKNARAGRRAAVKKASKKAAAKKRGKRTAPKTTRAEAGTKNAARKATPKPAKANVPRPPQLAPTAAGRRKKRNFADTRELRDDIAEEVLVSAGDKEEGAEVLPPRPLRGPGLDAVDWEQRSTVRATPPDQLASAARDTIIQRTPHMDLSAAEPLNPGSRFKATIFADRETARVGEESDGIIITAPAEVPEFKVDVKLVVSAHFKVLGQEAGETGIRTSTPEIIITRERPESTRISFELQVVGAKKLANTQPTITALFYYNGRPSGKVTRKPAINGLNVRIPAKSGGDTQSFASNVRPPTKEPPPSVEINHEAQPADLTISILETEEKDGCHFRMLVGAPAFSEQWEGSWTLPNKTDVIVSGAMTTFTSSQTSPTARIGALKGAGIQMFRATPRGFQDVFWRMIDSGKPLQTILIVSEEPFIPWEIMVPQRRKPDGSPETREALGAEFAIGRWVTDKYVSPPQKIAFGQTYIVAPQYPPNRQLKTSPMEVQILQASFSPSSVISPALVQNIDSTLGLGGTTLLHFVCHGKSGFPQAISLEQDREQLTCWQVSALQGFASSFPKARTFVFLNACEVGRLTPSLVGVGGFGNAFIEIGSSGVVAPLWSVDDTIAHQVATEFYTATSSSPSAAFAEILRRIRGKAYSGSAEDTWAAYCFYGDPLAYRT